MYNIKILDNSTGNTWSEKYSSYYLYTKRINKLKYSKKLSVVRHGREY